VGKQALCQMVKSMIWKEKTRPLLRKCKSFRHPTIENVTTTIWSIAPNTFWPSVPVISMRMR
jgi:hypothetical protein